MVEHIRLGRWGIRACRNQQIQVAIIVKICRGRDHLIGRILHGIALGDFTKSAIAIVAVEDAGSAIELTHEQIQKSAILKISPGGATKRALVGRDGSGGDVGEGGLSSGGGRGRQSRANGEKEYVMDLHISNVLTEFRVRLWLVGLACRNDSRRSSIL